MNTWVSFQSAEQPLLGQFSVSSNNLQDLVAFALDEGWIVARTKGCHVKFLKVGYCPIFTSFTPSDRRAGLNARAQLRRAQPMNELDQTL